MGTLARGRYMGFDEKNEHQVKVAIPTLPFPHVTHLCAVYPVLRDSAGATAFGIGSGCALVLSFWWLGDLI